MPFVPIPGGIEGVITLQNAATGQRYVNVLHFYKYTGGNPTPGNVDAVANWLATTLWTAFRPCITTNVKLLECKARDIHVAAGYSHTDTTNSGQAGTAGGDQLPGGSAITLSWRTAGTGRRARGRSYLSGLSEANVSADRIDNSLLANLFQVGAALIGSNIDTVLYFAIRSLADQVMKVVTGFVQDTAIDSQRNRLLNRGT